MKTLLLIGGSMLLLYSCADSPNSNAEESLSDDEMKNRVEVEEVEFEIELKDGELKDSMNSEDRADGEKDKATSLGKMKDEVPRVYAPEVAPNLEHNEEVHVNIPPPSNKQQGLVRMRCILNEFPSDPDPDEYGVYSYPEIGAEYPDGVKEMKVFIADNLIYPNPSDCVQGRVYVTFIVEKDGCVTHAEVMRGGISKELNEEALRVVRAMPKWIPAQHNGEVVASRLRMPISFTLN